MWVDDYDLGERQRRDSVVTRVIEMIRRDDKIKLPTFDRRSLHPVGDFALESIPENDFAGTVGPFCYQFEGEDDLLHLIVARLDRQELTVNEGREVAAFVLAGVPAAVIWLKPGSFSQHFYLGHDEMLSVER